MNQLGQLVANQANFQEAVVSSHHSSVPPNTHHQAVANENSDAEELFQSSLGDTIFGIAISIRVHFPVPIPKPLYAIRLTQRQSVPRTGTIAGISKSEWQISRQNPHQIS